MARRAALGLVLGLGMAAPALGWESAELAQLPQGDPARKLAILHHQEALLEQIVTSVCYVDAGLAPERHRALAYAARDRFEATLPDIAAEIARLDPKHPSARRLQREIAKKTERWYRFRVLVEGELKAAEPSPEALFQITGLEEGLVGMIERAYKLVRRDMIKSGKLALADTIAESATFHHVFLVQRLAKETCLVVEGAGGAYERAKLGEAIGYVDQMLEADARSLVVDPTLKALIPEWQALMPEIRALREGGAAAPDLLVRLEALVERWGEAAGAPSLEIEQS
ncbi:MAG: hypothetical protein ACFBWO_10260 [Paracoccaceae bacterium]